ncbi:MAG: DUF3820 family protein [Bacteroidales bacterium]|nr:DUF3820 family protein [Bacteroidales bacterium]MCF8390212.1 DUF3820 family protein [Bacteroidales bacterium]
MGEEILFDSKILLDLIKVKMPFGRYKGQAIYRLPEAYLVWFKQKGFPPGKLGLLMATMYEIKLNGLEYLLEKLNRS